MTEKKKGVEALKEIDIDKYNGVDVKKAGQRKNGLISYLTLPSPFIPERGE